jgi:F-type H+-transporting ATPase subunit b
MQPIIAVFGIDWKILGFQAFNFTVALVVLYYFLYKPVLALIEERRVKIEGGLEDAKQASENLKRAEQEKAEIVKAAHTEASAVALRAKAHSDEKTATLMRAAEEKSQRVMEDAKKAGEDLQKRLYKESEAEIAKTALLAAEKILKERA